MRALMDTSLFMVVSTVFGGLALFLFGMHVMTDGLRAVAGNQMRVLLSHAGDNRWLGSALGMVLGFLVHSSAATVMVVAFVHAGLMSLVASLPAVFGANLGTTLSMQLISIKLGNYATLVIAIGFFLRLFVRNQRTKQVGNALLGFGLIFLGMNVMSDAMFPYRESLRPLLERVNATSMGGMLFGVILSLGITAIIQSSGATIGMCFALIDAQVFTSLEQVYPIVLGAHIGTCATALLGSLGTHIEAKRVAVSHLLFNLCAAGLGLLMVKPFLILMGFTSPSLVRQTANLHTFLALVTTLILLPMPVLFSRLVRWLTPSKREPPEPSYLEPGLLDRPEQAIYAVISELRRVTIVCSRSLRLNADLLVMKYRSRTVQQIRLNEAVINEIKTSMGEYLSRMTLRRLSKRQALMVQHLDRCIVEVERIGDHIDSMCDLSLERRRNPQTLVKPESFEKLFALYEKVDEVLRLVIESLDPEQKDFQKVAEEIFVARNTYMKMSLAYRSDFSDEVAARRETALAGLYYNRYIAIFDRLVKHSKTIALAEQKPAFWIKRRKLEKVVGRQTALVPPDRVDPEGFLERLQSEDYL